MELTSETMDEVCVCRISGRLDAEVADAFRSGLHQLERTVAGPIVLNLEKVGFIGSACLGAMISFRGKLGQGRVVAVCGLSVPIHKMFKFATLDQVFQITATEADAIALLRGR